MKKSRSMRLASALLVLTLLSTCMISGTFAKYTTQDSAYDEARVAKWGVELQVGGDLYGEDYTKTTGDIVGTSDLTVSSSNDGENVVAPGTKSENGLDFSLKGTPEVSGTVTTTIEYENIYLNEGTYGVAIQAEGVTADNFDKWGGLYVKDGNTYTVATAYAAENVTKYYTIEDLTEVAEIYYPVEYQMTGTGLTYNETYNTALTTDTLKGIVDTIGTNGVTATVVDGKSTVTWTESFDPNTVLEDVFNLDKQQISWKWDFCNETDGTTHVGDAVKDSYCGADTIIGNLQAGVAVVKEGASGTFAAPLKAEGTNVNDYNLETSFKIDITVTQVD